MTAKTTAASSAASSSVTQTLHKLALLGAAMRYRSRLWALANPEAHPELLQQLDEALGQVTQALAPLDQKLNKRQTLAAQLPKAKVYEVVNKATGEVWLATEDPAVVAAQFRLQPATLLNYLYKAKGSFTPRKQPAGAPVLLVRQVEQ